MITSFIEHDEIFQTTSTRVQIYHSCTGSYKTRGGHFDAKSLLVNQETHHRRTKMVDLKRIDLEPYQNVVLSFNQDTIVTGDKKDSASSLRASVSGHIGKIVRNHV